MLTQSVIESGIDLGIMILNEFLSLLDFSTFLSHLEVLVLVLFEILKYVYFFLPVPYLIPLISLVFLVVLTRIGVAFVRFCMEIVNSIPVI